MKRRLLDTGHLAVVWGGHNLWTEEDVHRACWADAGDPCRSPMEARLPILGRKEYAMQVAPEGPVSNTTASPEVPVSENG